MKKIAVKMTDAERENLESRLASTKKELKDAQRTQAKLQKEIQSLRETLKGGKVVLAAPNRQTAMFPS